MKFVNASGIPSNFVPPGDYSFWSLLNEVIQEEPSEVPIRPRWASLPSIGIEKGKPFNPDARMKKILDGRRQYRRCDCPGDCLPHP